MLKKISLTMCLILIITAANILFIYWYDAVQWLILISSSSILTAIVKINMKSKLKIILASWIASIPTSISSICFPAILWEEDVLKVNEVIISTTERLIFVTLIGLIVSMIATLFFSLIMEEKL